MTKLFSSFILLTEYANEIVTAKGNPSGIAATMILTAKMQAYITVYKDFKHKKQWLWNIIFMPKWIIKAAKVTNAANIPIFPI